MEWYSVLGHNTHLERTASHAKHSGGVNCSQGRNMSKGLNKQGVQKSQVSNKARADTKVRGQQVAQHNASWAPGGRAREDRAKTEAWL